MRSTDFSARGEFSSSECITKYVLKVSTGEAGSMLITLVRPLFKDRSVFLGVKKQAINAWCTFSSRAGRPPQSLTQGNVTLKYPLTVCRYYNPMLGIESDVSAQD